MAHLIISLDGLVLEHIALEQGRTTIGRHADNNVQLNNQAISACHLTLTLLGNDAFLEDCNSTNGTTVNGTPVRRCILHDQDVIHLGNYQLRYCSDHEQETLAVFPDTALHGGEENAASVVIHDKPPARVAELQILNGAHSGRTLTLHRSVTTLGKTGASMAAISQRGEHYFIAPLDNQHDVTVNTTAIGPGAQQLEDQDVIETGGVRMIFFSQAAKSPSRPCH